VVVQNLFAIGEMEIVARHGGTYPFGPMFAAHSIKRKRSGS
jgi:hypothetical protein